MILLILITCLLDDVLIIWGEFHHWWLVTCPFPFRYRMKANKQKRVSARLQNQENKLKTSRGTQRAPCSWRQACDDVIIPSQSNWRVDFGGAYMSYSSWRLLEELRDNAVTDVTVRLQWTHLLIWDLSNIINIGSPCWSVCSCCCFFNYKNKSFYLILSLPQLMFVIK